jgi:hypothetical protein
MKRNKKHFHGMLSVACLAAVIWSCSGSLSKDEYGQWITDYDNGLHVKTEQGDFRYDVQYVPAEWKNFQTASYSESEPDSTDGLQYYMLTVGSTVEGMDLVDFGISSLEEKQRKLYYFSYLFQDDISLLDGDELLPCVLYHFEKDAAIRKTRTFMLGFERTAAGSEEVKLKINSPWLGAAPVSIHISKRNIPHLTL